MEKKLQILKENTTGFGILIENNNPEAVLKRVINESGKDGNLFKISGIMAQGDKLNRNGRNYPYETVLYPACERFRKETVEGAGGAVAELEHPDSLEINVERACARISKIWYDKPNVMCEAIVLDYGFGLLVQSFYNAGFQKYSCSTRGTGTVQKNNNVSTDFYLYTTDFVYNPSAPDANLYHMANEASELIYRENLLTEQELESFQKIFKKLNPKDRAKNFELYNKVMNTIKYGKR